jgi:hypothetical protein
MELKSWTRRRNASGLYVEALANGAESAQQKRGR